jgi:uncharacterized protein YndB with AHSA1/START domain
MGREISEVHEVVVDAGVDDVWSAIATGPGIDSWFMGRNEVGDGVVRTGFGECEIVASEPGRRFAYTTPVGPDGRFIGYDFLVEGRAGGSTSVRIIASGFLPGDDWHDEYVAMEMGHALFFRTLVEYLTFFAGRTATPVDVSGPVVTDWPAAFTALARELGRPDAARPGDQVTVRVAGTTVGGVVYFVNDHCLAVRTPDALYRFVRGLNGRVLAMHHIFNPPEHPPEFWTTWLTSAVTPPA